MYVAYVDDSADTDQSVYVLAGYISTPEQWKLFSRDWSETLIEEPQLKYLRMSEAHSRRGEFQNAHPEIVAYRLSRFYGLIERYVLGEFSFQIRPADIRRICGPESLWSRHPFYLSHNMLMVDVAAYLSMYGLPDDEIEFVFDDQLGEKRKVFEAWNETRSKPSHSNVPNLRRVLQRPPRFVDDKITPPLQAADLLAWWQRRRCLERSTQCERLEYPWPINRGIRGMEISYNAQQLADFLLRAQPISGKLSARLAKPVY